MAFDPDSELFLLTSDRSPAKRRRQRYFLATIDGSLTSFLATDHTEAIAIANQRIRKGRH